MPLLPCARLLEILPYFFLVRHLDKAAKASYSYTVALLGGGCSISSVAICLGCGGHLLAKIIPALHSSDCQGPPCLRNS